MTGRWAGMWQFVTVEASIRRPTAQVIRKFTGLVVGELQRLGSLNHALTHRRYRFDVYICESSKGKPRQNGSTAWVTLSDLPEYPLPRPHLKIAEMLRTRELSVTA